MEVLPPSSVVDTHTTSPLSSKFLIEEQLQTDMAKPLEELFSLLPQEQ